MLLNLRTLSDVTLDERQIEMGRMNYYGSDFARSGLRFRPNTQETGRLTSTVFPSLSSRTVEVDLENDSGQRNVGDHKNPSKPRKSDSFLST